MILYVNTIKESNILLEVRDGEEVIEGVEFEAKYAHAEKLLPAIDSLVEKANLTLKDITKILVENYGGGFTSLRIGVVTANALGFALGIPVVGTHGEQHGDMVVPYYIREPNIG